MQGIDLRTLDWIIRLTGNYTIQCRSVEIIFVLYRTLHPTLIVKKNCQITRNTSIWWQSEKLIIEVPIPFKCKNLPDVEYGYFCDANKNALRKIHENFSSMSIVLQLLAKVTYRQDIVKNFRSEKTKGTVSDIFSLSYGGSVKIL